MQREVLALLSLAAKIALLLAGMLLPGAAAMRALAVPRTLGACFAASVLVLYVTVLALDFAAIRISVRSMSVGLGVAIALFSLAARQREKAVAAASERTDWLIIFRRMGAWTPLFALAWIALIWRAVHDPLAGPDIEFRWSFLAEQMLRHGSLGFYPPHHAADFTVYYWAESVPPAVAALHAWAYACAGSFEPAWTVPGVVLQLWALHDLLWHGAERIGGFRAARLACMAAASTPLLAWSFFLGQETGLTTLALVGMIVALHGWQQTRAVGWVALAALFSVLGSVAREYGMIFPVLAGLGLLGIGGNRRAWLTFAAVVWVSFAWPLRTFLLTGNPFYSLPFAGLPINERFVAWIEHGADALGAVLKSAEGWTQVARYLVQFAPLALVGFVVLVPGLFRAHSWRREAIALVFATGVIFALWVASVRYTDGGLFYSLRVISPALGVGALVAGIGLGAVAARRPKLYRRAALALGLLTLGTIPSTLALPQNPWRTPPREWPAFAERRQPPVGPADEIVAIIRQSGASGIVVADQPGYQRRFRAVDITVIPPWSPDADWLFDLRLSPRDAARRWRESGVRFVVITKWQRHLEFLNAHARWMQPPFHVQKVGETAQTVVFEIIAPE